MEIKVKLNGKNVIGNVEADTVLIRLTSVKRDALALSADVTHQTADCARYLWIISRFYHVQSLLCR